MRAGLNKGKGKVFDGDDFQSEVLYEIYRKVREIKGPLSGSKGFRMEGNDEVTGKIIVTSGQPLESLADSDNLTLHMEDGEKFDFFLLNGRVESR